MRLFDNGDLTLFENGKLTAPGVVESTGGGFRLPDGTLLDEASDLGQLNLPFTSSRISASRPLFQLLQTGTGGGGRFVIENSDNGANAVSGVTDGGGNAVSGIQNGTGNAGFFTHNNPDASGHALKVEADGGGRAVEAIHRGDNAAGFFRIDNENNDQPAFTATTNGSGSAVRGLQTGVGFHGGIFSISDDRNTSAALKATTRGSGPAAEFSIIENSGDPAALSVSTVATGPAADLEITNSNSDADALTVSTEGSGLAADVSSSIQGVARDNPTQNVARIRNTSGGSGPDVLALQSGPSNPGGELNYVTFYDGSGTSLGAVEGNGNGGVEFKTSGADFAEKLPVVEDAPMPEPKDLVGVRGRDVSLETEGADRLMIASSSPAVTGNATPSTKADDGRRVPVAFVGQVPVQLRGKAEVGDLIVASGEEDGTARAVSPEEYRSQEHGPIAGQAWSAKSTEKVGEVTVAVGLGRSGEVAAQLKEQRTQISALQEQNEEIKARQQKLEERISRLEAQSGSSVVASLSGSGLLIGLLVGGLVGAGLFWRRRR